jgi:hypothetical protein
MVLVLLCSFLVSKSQRTYHHGVFWGRLVLSDRITDKLKWEVYLQKRTQNIPGQKNIFEADHFYSTWLWFNFALAKNLKLSLSPFGYFDSYAFLSKASDVANPGIKEFRWTVRLENEQRFKYVTYSNRYSLEYRRRDLYQNDVYLPNWRVRYMVRLEKPVTGILSKSKPLSFFMSDEVFLQFGKAVRGNPNVFDQNRISVGVSYEVLKNVKTSVSYLNILQQRNSGKEFDNADVLWLVLTFDNLFSQFKRQKQ